MPKSYDDPDGNSDSDPIELARVAREQKERERLKRRSRPIVVPVEPPDSSWPPKPVPGVGTPSIAYRPREPTFGSGLAHLAHASGQLPKRVAVLVALWGAVSTTGAVGLVYLMSQYMVSLDRYAKDEAMRKEADSAIRRDLEGLRSTVNDLRVKIAAVEAASKMLQQEPIYPEKKRR